METPKYVMVREITQNSYAMSSLPDKTATGFGPLNASTLPCHVSWFSTALQSFALPQL